MDFRRSIPAVLLIVLAVPAVQASASPSIGSSTSPAASNLASANPLANARPTQSRVKRRGDSESEAALSCEAVTLAGDYLRSRSQGIAPSLKARAAWDKFFLASDAAIRRFARAYRSRGVDVDDCTQEVWTDLTTSLPKFAINPSRGQFTSWLYTIVRSKATNIIRRQSRMPTALASVAEENLGTTDFDPSIACERKADRQLVVEAMTILKDRASDLSYRVLHLRHIESRSVAEVAETLGLTPEQVWVREHRMKRKLRDLIPFIDRSSSATSDGNGLDRREIA